MSCVSKSITTSKFSFQALVQGTCNCKQIHFNSVIVLTHFGRSHAVCLTHYHSQCEHMQSNKSSSSVVWCIEQSQTDATVRAGALGVVPGSTDKDDWIACTNMINLLNDSENLGAKHSPKHWAPSSMSRINLLAYLLCNQRERNLSAKIFCDPPSLQIWRFSVFLWLSF